MDGENSVYSKGPAILVSIHHAAILLISLLCLPLVFSSLYFAFLLAKCTRAATVVGADVTGFAANKPVSVPNLTSLTHLPKCSTTAGMSPTLKSQYHKLAILALGRRLRTVELQKDTCSAVDGDVRRRA